jgi:DtxR family Mn-dependent transcriptional regulator
LENNYKLTPSLENYLEAILFIETRNRVARVKDIADHLKVQMSSVTVALKNLKEKELVSYEKNSFIVLTEKGKVIAVNTQKKHDIIRHFLENILRLPPEEADKSACEIEHIIDLKTAMKISNCANYINESKEKSGISENDWEKYLSGKN